MIPSVTLFVGPLASPPALLLMLVLLVIVLLVGRVLLALAWRVVFVALVVVFALWLLGMIGIGPF